MKLKYFLATLFFIGALHGYSQTTPGDPTSATDSEVKIHNPKRFFLFGSSKGSKNIKPSTGVSQRAGEAMPRKIKAKRHSASKQAKVFQRHNHFADQEKAPRTKARTSRKN